MTAHIDVMATMLSEATGSEWSIVRGRPALPFNPLKPEYKKPPMRYALKAERKFTEMAGQTFGHVFQAHRPMNYNEMARFLSSILDMVHMGFIPTAKREREKVVEFLKRNYDAAAQDPGIPVNAADMINTVRICIEREEHL